MDKYLITTKPIKFEVEAENADDAMSKFAWEMDSDMNQYFEVVPYKEGDANG